MTFDVDSPFRVYGVYCAEDEDPVQDECWNEAGPLYDDSVIGEICMNHLSVRYFACEDNDVASVELFLDGERTACEDVEPYYMFGNGNDINYWRPPAFRQYNVEVVEWSQGGCRGEELKRQSVRFDYHEEHDSDICHEGRRS